MHNSAPSCAPAASPLPVRLSAIVLAVLAGGLTASGLHAANPSAPTLIRVTNVVERPADKVPALGVNHYGGSGAVEWAANNFVQNSGNEPIHWRNLHRVKVSGPDWFEIDGPGTSWFDLWASGLLSGADLRIYRLVDSEGNPVAENGAAPDMTRADHVMLVGTTRIIPEGAEGFPDGGWVASHYAEVHPNVNIQWGNNRATDNSGVLNGRTYWYSVVAIGEGGVVSDLATEVGATPGAGLDNGPRILVLSREDRLPAVTAGVAFSMQPKVYGGQAPLAWAVVDAGGNPALLPAGLSINASSGLITGTPAATAPAGTPLRLKVTDAASRSDTRTWLMNPATPVASGNGKPLPPTGLQALAGDGCVTISWTPSPSAGVTGYALRRSTAPLAQQQSRVHVVAGSPPILPYDHVVVQRRFDPFEMRYVNSRVRGIGNPMDRPAWNWNTGGRNVEISLVPHPAPVPAEMLEPGETCMQVETFETSAVSINQTVFVGLEQGYESIWYGQLEPGRTYRLEVWMRQEGLLNNGAVAFSFGTSGGTALAGIGTTFQVTGTWQKFTYDFTGPARSTAPWYHFGHKFAFTGPGRLWMDNCRIFRFDQPQDLAKPYVPNANVFNELLASAPPAGPKGAQRCWVLSRDLTMDNILSWHGNSQVRPDWITGVSGTGEMMLPQALEWCRLTGDTAATRVVPWITMQHILHEEADWQALVEYLAAPYDPATDTPAGKPWAYRRYQQRGTGTPWMDEFRELIIEFGNETWHNGTNEAWLGFGGYGQIWAGGQAYGMFARHLIEAIQASPYWTAQNLEGRIRFALGDGYPLNGEGLSYGEEAMLECPQADILARANYVGPKWETGDVSSGVFDDDGIQETLLSYPVGEEENFQNKKATRDAMAAAGHAYDLAAYESGPSGYALPGTASAEIVEVNERYGKSLAMGVASLDAWLGAYRNGWTYQAFFAYGQGLYWNSHTPFWDEFRPTPGWQAMALRNQHASGDLMAVATPEVATLSRLGKEHPLVVGHAFRDGDRWSVILLNRKLGGVYRGQDQGAGTIPVTLNLPFKTADKITLHALSGDPREGNRDSLVIQPQTRDIPVAALGVADGAFVVNETTGAAPGGLPPGSIHIYVFEGVGQPFELMSITSGYLPPTTEADPYSQQLEAIGGTGPYTWALVGGSLPEGFQFSPGGLISGVSGVAGTSQFTVRVTDSLGNADTRSFSVTIHPAPVFNTVYEGFNYAPGSDLSILAQPAGFTAWKPGRAPGYTAVAGSLPYASGGTLATSGNTLSGGNAWQTTGMSLDLSNPNWDRYKTVVDNQYTSSFPGSYSTVIGRDNRTMYVSFLMRSTSDESVFGLYNDGYSAGQPFSQLAVGAAVRVTAAGSVTLRTGSYTTGTFDAVPNNSISTAAHPVQDASGGSVPAGSTNLYVLKFEFGQYGVTADRVSLFVNPVVGAAEPGTASAAIAADGNLVLSSMAIYLGHTAGFGRFDELRIGATWADVVPAVPPPLTGMQAWLDANGLPVDGTGDGAPDADPAGDGISNVMKYALGLAARTPGYQGRLADGFATAGGSDYLSLTYVRPEPAPEGVAYIVETCGDLSSWSGAGVSAVSSTVLDGLRTVTVRDTTAIDAGGPRFIRLKVGTP